VNSVVADPSSNFYTLKVKTATNFFSIQYVYLVENLRYTEQVTIEATPEKN
jgi:rod shape-determining protein MreC